MDSSAKEKEIDTERDLEIKSQKSSRAPSIQETSSVSEKNPCPEAREDLEASPQEESEGESESESYPPIVPRSQRRGLLGRFTVIPEVYEPTRYPRRTKWTLTIIVALAAAAAPMGSATLMPALTDVARDFKVSESITNLSVAMYMLAMSIFPLWWSSFCETLGRRTIYIVSFTFFVVFAILSAVAKSISMLIVVRLLSGGAAASVQSVGAGSIADIWEPRERGQAMGIFYLGPLCGPVLGPVIGGALAEAFGWRATQWFLVVFGACLMIMLVFALPETLRRKEDLLSAATTKTDDVQIAQGVGEGGVGKGASNVQPVQSARPSLNLQRSVTGQSVKENTKKTVKVLKRCFIDPLKIILLLRFPAVAVTVYYAAITFGTLYFLNISIETSFSRPPYNFSTIVVGLMYLPNSVGYFLASILGGRWIDHIMKREAKKKGRVDENGKLIYRPEDRMKENAWAAAIMFPLAIIWYGWAVDKGLIWVVPVGFPRRLLQDPGIKANLFQAIANFFFGFGSMLIFSMATTMLTEFMPKKASTGIAVNNFVRNIFSCVGGVIAAPLINAIGNGWLCTILGIVALISGFGVVWSMKTFGDRWRVQMDKKMNS
jgi:multidrug resistance protein